MSTPPNGRAKAPPEPTASGRAKAPAEPSHESHSSDSCRAAIQWPGGKRWLLPVILPLIPPHTCYVEPFGGGLSVLLAKPRSPVEVANDTDGDLVNFYRVARFHLEPLLAELRWLPNSREEFHALRHQPGLTDIQRAGAGSTDRKPALVASTGRASEPPSWAVGRHWPAARAASMLYAPSAPAWTGSASSNSTGAS
jgi:hypothetical protein